MKDGNGHTYATLAQEGTAEFTDRGSRFIAYALPVASEESFRERLKALRKEHPKAVHHCHAYRIGIGTVRSKSGDDGEPSGSAGRPILGQIEARSLTDTAVIVVRYFGGTLLGIPGLINAYRSAAALALQVVPILEKPVEDRFELAFDHARLNDVMTVLKRHQCTILRQEAGLFCHFSVGIPRRSKDTCVAQLGNLQGVDFRETKPQGR